MVHGHVVVCGTRGIATRIIEQLTEAGEQVVVLDESVVSAAEALRVAGIGTARAVVCVTASDVRNLELALLARELRPELRVVSQLGNQAVGAAMETANGPGAVLDVARLAAPTVVAACLSRRSHAIPVGDVEFLAVSAPATLDGSLRRNFGDLAPVAVVRAGPDGVPDEVVPCPGRDLPVRSGDRVTVLGTHDELAARGLAPATPAAAEVRASRRRRLLSAAHGLWWTARSIDRGLYLAVAVLATLVVVSMVVLWNGYRSPGMSLLDALYFSVETVATVGYGDFTFIGQVPWLRFYAIFLMIAGITSTAVLMSFLTDLLISRRLGHEAGRRRARAMVDHVVVVGLGSFGIEVARELLAAGRQVVVVERSEHNRFLGAAAELGVPVVFGDATLPSTLESARVSSAAAVAVMTSDDMVNIETGLAVRAMLGPRFTEGGADVPVVMRVFDRGLGRAVSHRFGFRNVHATEEIAAPSFVGAALGLEVVDTFAVATERFVVGRVTIDPDGGLAGVAMHELSAHTRVIGLVRAATGETEHPPRRGTRFEPGDVAYLVGPYQELLGVLRTDRVRPADAPG